MYTTTSRQHFATYLVKHVAKQIGCTEKTMQRVCKDIAAGITVYLKTSKGAYNIRTTRNGKGIETLKVG